MRKTLQTITQYPEAVRENNRQIRLLWKELLHNKKHQNKVKTTQKFQNSVKTTLFPNKENIWTLYHEV